MTIHRAPYQNGRVHTNGASPQVDPEQAATEREGGVTRLLMPALLLIIAAVMVRRLQRSQGAL